MLSSAMRALEPSLSSLRKFLIELVGHILLQTSLILRAFLFYVNSKSWLIHSDWNYLSQSGVLLILNLTIFNIIWVDGIIVPPSDGPMFILID